MNNILRPLLLPFLFSCSLSPLLVAQVQSDEGYRRSGLALPDDEIRKRVDELNTRAATRPGAITAAQHERLKHAQGVRFHTIRAKVEREYSRLNAAAAARNSAISARLYQVRAEGIALERHRDNLIRTAESDLAVAKTAGTSTISGVVGHRAFGGTIHNEYDTLRAIREVEEKYGRKLEPVNARIAELAAVQNSLVAEQAAIRREVMSRPSIERAATLASQAQRLDLSDPDPYTSLRAEYPGVDIESLFAQSLRDAARDTGIDPDKVPAETPAGQALNDLANNYFHERAAALVKSNLVTRPTTDHNP